MRDIHLILSTPRDLHAAAVSYALQYAGFDTEMHPFLGARDLAQSSLSFDDGRVDVALAPSLGRIRSIWNRRPQWQELPYPVPADDVAFAQQQWRQFIDNIHLLAPEHLPAFWINSHRAAADAEIKALQLITAARVGLRVPRTLMSSDPARIRAFLASGDRFVFKSFTPFTWIHQANGHREAAMTQAIDRHTAVGDASLRVAPGIYQEFIDKRDEVRATVIGDRVFAMRMRSNRRPGIDEVDWRAAAHDDQALVEACTLPAALEDKLHRLLRELGLVQGSIDLAVDADGDAHFLEINQSGQFLYVEQRLPELPLLAAFCSLFTQARRDYRIDPSFPCFADFLGSERHRQWQSDEQEGGPRDGGLVRLIRASA